MTRRWLLVVLLVLGVGATPSAAAPTTAPTVTVLSNARADLVSDGQALVGISGPRSTQGLTVTIGGRDVSGDFAVRAGGRVEGIVSKLRNGPNVLTVRAPGMRVARLTITNHPNGGPIFGGPQIQP
ncbi:MAG: N-acetylmuramoyl-L-alanine amidase [Frankiales bacterium]|nr:N-acetylmuramoyl-L-alanine amidase [Frankiales bacterium]